MRAEPPPTEPFARPLLALTSVLMAAPVALSRWAPVQDLAEYEFALAAIRGFGDPARFSERVYRLQPGGANQLLFALSVPLSYVLGVDLANRLTVALILAAMPWCLAHAARTYDRSQLVAVALAPFALGASFRWGLLGNLLSLALVLLALRPLAALTRAPSPRGAVYTTAAITLAALAHGSAVTILGLVAAPSLVGLRRSPRDVAWVLAPFVPPVALIGAQVRLYDQNANAAFRAFTDPEHPRLGRFFTLADNLAGPLPGHAAVGLTALTLAALWFYRRAVPKPADVAAQAVVGALLLAQYWIWPYGYHGAGLLYLRFLLPGVWLLGLAFAPRPHAAGRAPLAALVAAPLAMSLALAPLLQSASATYRALDRLAPRVAVGSSIAFLDWHGADEGLGVLGRPAAHLVAQRGGRTWSFADAPQYAVRTRDAASWASGIRLANPANLVPEIDLARYRYLLIALPTPELAGPLLAAMGGCARPVAWERPFALFESTCLTLPIDAPEPPLPADRPRSLGWRLQHPGAPVNTPLRRR